MRTLPFLDCLHRAVGLLAILLIHPNVGAAVRTVQFSGLAGGEFTVGELSNRNNVAYCQVAVVNTGTSDQKVTSADFLDYNSGSQRTSGSAWLSADHRLLRTSSSATDECLGATLSEGGMCLFRFATNAVSADGRYVVCAGRIVVEDVDAAQPGSVVASGAVSFLQETKVLGGVLSGAYYQVGAHIIRNSTGANVRYHPSYPAPLSMAIRNMNLYCGKACVHKGGSNDFCEAHCGQVNTSADPGSVTYGLLYWDSRQSTANRVLDNAMAYSGTYPSYEKTTTTNVNAGQTLDPITLSPNPSTFSINPYPSVLRGANDHYAFGMVFEMIMGPLVSICSGVVAFEEQGGEDFTHADSVDPLVAVAGSSAGGPPENLLCSHRHAADDLFMGTGSSSPFAINGGMPF